MNIKFDPRVWLFFLIIIPIPLVQAFFSAIGAGSVTLYQLVVFLCAIVAVGSLSKSLINDRITILLLFFFAMAFFNGYIFGDNLDYAKIKLGQSIIVILTVLITSGLNRNRFNYILLAKLILCYCILMVITMFAFGSPHNGRYMVLDMNPIWLGRIFGMGLVISSFFYLNSKCFKKKLTYLLFILIFLFSSRLTGSFGPLLSSFVAMYYLFFHINKVQKKSYFMAIVYSLRFLFLPALIGLSILFFMRLNAAENASFFYRFAMIQESLKLDNISLFGVGLGNYYRLGGYSEVFFYPHNIFIETFVELGSISLLVLLYIFFLLRRIIVSLNDTERIVIAPIIILFIYYGVNSLFSGDLMTGNIYLYVFAVLLSKFEKNKNVVV